MRLAKDRLDIALMTDRVEVLEFWRDHVGIPLEEILPVRRGWVQYRFDLCDSVFKLNVVDDGVPPGRRSRVVEVVAADASRAGRSFTDTDGTTIRFVAPGDEGIDQIAIVLEVSDAAAARAYYVDVLGWQLLDDDAVRCARSIVRWRESAPPLPDLPDRGWAYLTVQIHECDAEHAELLARGATEGGAPVTLGTTARYSLVRDPDGNWLEISQRASLTGPLPS